MVIARRWLDQESVAAIMDVPGCAIALAAADLARDRNRVFIGSGASLLSEGGCALLRS